jgi:superfamily II DNA/RNA helicase
MFTAEEIREATQNPSLSAALKWVRDALTRSRLRRPLVGCPISYAELAHFSECVLCSAPSWNREKTRDLCEAAAEASEVLSKLFLDAPERSATHQIRAALLYEFAGKPSVAAAASRNWPLSPVLTKFIARQETFGSLRVSPSVLPEFASSPRKVFESAWIHDATSLAQFQHCESDAPNFVTEKLESLSTQVSLGVRATEIHAFASVLKDRRALSSRNFVDTELFLEARQIGFPVELWPQQAKALAEGFLDRSFNSFGLAAPTGTGKTYLARILILDTLRRLPTAKVLYVVPSRALVSEVTTNLSETFKETSYKVTSVRPSIVALDKEENIKVEEDSVVVMTPEKADLLLRMGSDFLQSIELVVIDEAHHIESGTRGILLEMHLTRLRRILKKSVRLVFLSAVAPNIGELAACFGTRSGKSEVELRSTRMRAGVYRIRGRGRDKQGWIDYSDNTSFPIISSNIASGKRATLIQLVAELSRSGPVLVVTKGKGECETLGKLMVEWCKKNSLKSLDPSDLASEHVQRLDARLEREMYKDVKMRKYLPHRVAYHHAGLPPRVRRATEEAIRRGYIDFVFATTTLAEGVNFPFSSVVVQSLAIRSPPELGVPSRYHPVTPRSFWNIAGRAGRPGFDSEGQVILFEPSLGIDKIKATLGDYLDSSFNGVPPVGSALADAIQDIRDSLHAGHVSWNQLASRALAQELPRPTQGALNLLRTSIIHAKAEEKFESPEEIFDSTFASKILPAQDVDFGRKLTDVQSQVVDAFFKESGAPSLSLAAELGLSIETLSALRDFAKSIPDNRIRAFGGLFYGGWINFTQARPLVAVVADRMSELEGTKLGALQTELIMQWLSGIPFNTVKRTTWSGRRSGNVAKSLEDLISHLYSRVQFLLPWGLYALDKLVKAEAKLRELEYNNQIGLIAYLVDAGVPCFDALRLTSVDMERVDATRLAHAFRDSGASGATDIIGWLLVQPRRVIEKLLAGPDNRRLDYDLNKVLSQLREEEPRRT